LAGGVSVRLSARRIIVLPARTRTAGGGGIQVRYCRIAVFDHLRAPMVEPLGLNDPIRGAFESYLTSCLTSAPPDRARGSLVRRWLILFLRLLRRAARGRPCWATAPEDERLGRAMSAMQDRRTTASRCRSWPTWPG
jgi:hypothetical protein